MEKTQPMGHREFLRMPFSLEAEPRNRHNGNSSQLVTTFLSASAYLFSGAGDQPWLCQANVLPLSYSCTLPSYLYDLPDLFGPHLWEGIAVLGTSGLEKQARNRCTWASFSKSVNDRVE